MTTQEKHNQCVDSLHGSIWRNQAVLFLIAELQKKKVRNTLTGRQKAIKAGDRRGRKSRAEKQSALKIDPRGQVVCQQKRSESCFSISAIFNTEGVLILPFFMYLHSNRNFYQEVYFLFSLILCLFLSFFLFQFTMSPFEAEFKFRSMAPILRVTGRVKERLSRWQAQTR